MGVSFDSVASSVWMEWVFIFKNLHHLIPSGSPINLKDLACSMRWGYACEQGMWFWWNGVFPYGSYPNLNIAQQ